MTLLAATSTPATTITTTSETLAANIPAFPLSPPGAAQAIVIRGNIAVTTGTAVTALAVRLRVGQNNTTTALVDAAEPMMAAASGSYSAPFEFEDTVFGDANSGYSLTVVQTGATGNGTITQVEYSVDLAIP